MGYSWIDHTAELELRIGAETEAGVFEAALLAVRELLAGEGGGDEVSRELIVRAGDRAALLAAWIEELVYLVESESVVPERLAAIELDAGGLAATVTARAAEPRHLIKAATYHRLRFERCGAGFEATVVLDV